MANPFMGYLFLYGVADESASHLTHYRPAAFRLPRPLFIHPMRGRPEVGFTLLHSVAMYATYVTAIASPARHSPPGLQPVWLRGPSRQIRFGRAYSLPHYLSAAAKKFYT